MFIFRCQNFALVRHSGRYFSRSLSLSHTHTHTRRVRIDLASYMENQPAHQQRNGGSYLPCLPWTFADVAVHDSSPSWNRLGAKRTISRQNSLRRCSQNVDAARRLAHSSAATAKRNANFVNLRSSQFRRAKISRKS